MVNKFIKHGIIGIHVNRINLGSIPPHCKYSLKTNNAVPPKLYCLPKIHKDNIPLRPIITNINTPNCKISKYLANILSPLKYSSQFFIENSFQLIDKTKSLHCTNNFKLISLDVKSLLTSISHELIKLALENRWNEISNGTNISYTNL